MTTPGALAHNEREVMNPLLLAPAAGSFTLEWRVLQEDIDHGEREDCDKCPIALSLNRVLPGFLADVGGLAIILWEYTTDDRGNRWPVREAFRARTPVDGVRFVGDFDEDEMVSPITLTATFFAVAGR